MRIYCRRYPPIPTPPACVEAGFFEGDIFLTKNVPHPILYCFCISKEHPRAQRVSIKAARNDQRDQNIGHVGGRERALRRREVAVRSISAPGRAILRVFRCVIANGRAWGLKTWSPDERRDWQHGKPSGGQVFAATHPMFGAIDCHYLCQACCVAQQSLPCRAKALGVIRWNSQQEVCKTRWESLAAV